MLELQDRLAIHELMGLYGLVIDEREWHRAGELFTPDVVYDMSELGLGVLHGVEAVLSLWTTREDLHPVAHHATNVVVTPGPDPDTARVVSKGLGIGRKGRVGSVTYRDVVRRTGDGWRIAHRHARLRHPPDAEPAT
jgi:hypothetical protein